MEPSDIGSARWKQTRVKNVGVMSARVEHLKKFVNIYIFIHECIIYFSSAFQLSLEYVLTRVRFCSLGLGSCESH